MDIGERERQLGFLIGFDPAAAELDELREGLRYITATTGWLQAMKVDVKRRFEHLAAQNRPDPTERNPNATVGGGVDGCGGTPNDEMIDCGGKSNRDTRRTIEHDRVFEDFPGLRALVEDGRVSLDHVDVLAQLTKGLSDEERSNLLARRDEVIAAAVREYLDAFRRFVKRLLAEIREGLSEQGAAEKLESQRKRSKVTSWTDHGSGMHHTHIELDPLRGAELGAAVNREYRRLKQLPEFKNATHDEVMVEAIMSAIRNTGAGSGLPEISIIITADQLANHPQPRPAETPASAPTGSSTGGNDDRRRGDPTVNRPGSNGTAPHGRRPSTGTDPAHHGRSEDREDGVNAHGGGFARGNGSPPGDEDPAASDSDVSDIAVDDREPDDDGLGLRSCCETADGTVLPVATVQRLCCEAIIHPVLVSPDGRTVDKLGEPIRTANREQRRAIAALYATCCHPHCAVPIDRCRMHHIIWYSNGGLTILENLAPACESHHHQLHEGGWNLTLTGNQRQIDWRRPDGTIAYTTHPDRLTNTAAEATPAPSERSTGAAPATDTYQQPQLC